MKIIIISLGGYPVIYIDLSKWLTKCQKLSRAEDYAGQDAEMAWKTFVLTDEIYYDGRGHQGCDCRLVLWEGQGLAAPQAHKEAQTDTETQAVPQQEHLRLILGAVAWEVNQVENQQ